MKCIGLSTSQRDSSNRNVAECRTSRSSRNYGVPLHAYISNTVSRRKSESGCKHPWPSDYYRCKAQIRRTTKGRCWSTGTGKCTLNTQKISFCGQYSVTHFRENYKIMSRKILWPHRFTLCVQISRKLFAGKWVKRCVSWWQKVRKMLFAPRWRRAPKVCRERIPHNPHIFLTYLCKKLSRLS